MYPTIRGMPSSGNLLSAKHIPFKRFISSKSHLHFKKDQDYRRVAKKEKKIERKIGEKRRRKKVYLGNVKMTFVTMVQLFCSLICDTLYLLSVVKYVTSDLIF